MSSTPDPAPDFTKKKQKKEAQAKFVQRELSRQAVIRSLSGLRQQTILGSRAPASSATGTTLLQTGR